MCDVKTYVDCIPCLVRQALDSVRLVTDDEAVHEKLLREVLRATSEMDLHRSPPTMGQRIHHAIRILTGESDPYREMKAKCPVIAKDLGCRVETLVLRRSAHGISAV